MTHGRQVGHRAQKSGWVHQAARGAAYAYTHRRQLWKTGQKLARFAKHWKHRKGKSYSKDGKAEGHYAADDLHSGKSRNKVKIVLRKGKKMNKSTFGHFTYEQQNAFSVSNVIGTQTIFSLGADLTRDQIYSATIVADPSPNQYTQGLINYNPNYKTTGDLSGIIAPATTLGLSSKMFVKSIGYEYQFANMGTVAADVTLYVCVIRKPNAQFNSTNVGTWTTTGYDLAGLSAAIVTDTSLGMVGSVQASDANGLQTTAQTGSVSNSVHGFTPFSLQGFRKFAKCVYKKEINLAPAAIHKFEINVEVNKMFYDAELAEMGSNVNPGVTLSTFAILKGSPVIVYDGASENYNVNQAVTMGQCQLAATQTRKLKCHYVPFSCKTDQSYASRTFRTTSGTSVTKLLDIVDAVNTAKVV